MTGTHGLTALASARRKVQGNVRISHPEFRITYQRRLALKHTERTMESRALLTGEVGEASDHFALIQSEDTYAGWRLLEHPDAEWTALDVLVTVHYPYLPVSWSTHTATLLINARYRINDDFQ